MPTSTIANEQIVHRPAHKPGETVKIDIGTLSTRVVFSCAGLTDWTFQVDRGGLDWPTGTVPVLTFQISNDGLTWFNFPAGAETQNANGFGADVLSVIGIRFISAVVTTAAATAPMDAYLTCWGIART